MMILPGRWLVESPHRIFQYVRKLAGRQNTLANRLDESRKFLQLVAGFIGDRVEHTDGEFQFIAYDLNRLHEIRVV